ncbi:DUF305 family protein family protein [Pseudomonas sp. SJZ079]|uniref:CopM family metallochaperone n=1 Tax=Pseudomonas sp. SJZ079 TaxID=2572887 RepID=UPI0011999E1C|nr:DUF305 domain-containing protein [Pseudomonas sp. SJZ079]TWC28386.1 DUF305 family protein family protein [Pseudomonas sp. SJZ079]
MHLSTGRLRRGNRLRQILLGAALLPGLCAFAQQEHSAHASGHEAVSAPAPFVASSAHSFAELMDQAMRVMDQGMRAAPMQGDPDQDFVSMMIPHHQGAVDMAKALLLNGTDPEMRNLALAIITEQQNEIRLMRAWQQRQAERASGSQDGAQVPVQPEGATR